MHAGARALVFLVYSALGLSFVGETALLAWEFRDADWLTLATHDSHLFLFFRRSGSLRSPPSTSLRAPSSTCIGAT